MPSNTPTGAPLLLTPKEAAAALSVSERTLWAATFEREPAIPHLKVGRLTRYAAVDIERWIEDQKQGGSER